ncbi:MAG: glycosyltransferase, partial [Rhodospirillales bacterium]|nr:glycosyltransferase [Rhodospirillales bacterium]
MISVVIPTLQAGGTLSATLDAVTGAVGVGEVVVADAGSTDDSVAILERWSDRLAGWRSHPDAGQASAINE